MKHDRDDDMGQAQFVKEKVLNDLWWDKINYIITFTEPIYDMIRVTNTDKPYLHLVYDIGTQQSRRLKVLFIGTKKEKMSNHLFMMLYIKSWRIAGTRVTRCFNVWHTF